MINQIEIILPPLDRGFHLITDIVKDKLGELPEKGLLHLFIKHTSAGLTINENADPSVREDMESFISHLIPDGHSLFTHRLEGDDDMPAHLKSSIMGNSITIPVSNHKLDLGTWQGIYLGEFRNFKSSRKIKATIIS